MTSSNASTALDVVCFNAALRRASRRISQLYNDALESSGLRGTQYAILSQLHDRADAPPTLAVLAEAMVLDRSALGHNLRPLERDGYLSLREGTKDRRQREIVLTKKGEAKYRECAALWAVAQKRFIDIYGAEKGAALRASLLDIAHDERFGSLADDHV